MAPTRKSWGSAGCTCSTLWHTVSLWHAGATPTDQSSNWATLQVHPRCGIVLHLVQHCVPRHILRYFITVNWFMDVHGQRVQDLQDLQDIEPRSVNRVGRIAWFVWSSQTWPSPWRSSVVFEVATTLRCQAPGDRNWTRSCLLIYAHWPWHTMWLC